MYHAGHLSVNLKIAKGQLILTPKNIHDFTSWVLPSPPLPSPPFPSPPLPLVILIAIQAPSAEARAARGTGASALGTRSREGKGGTARSLLQFHLFVFLSVIRTFVLIFHSRICSFRLRVLSFHRRSRSIKRILHGR